MLDQALTRALACVVLLLTFSACTTEETTSELPPLPPKVAEKGLGPPGEARPLREAIVAFSGEVRGEIEPCGCPTVPYGGFARRAAALERLRAEGLPVFVLDAGVMLVRGQVAADPGDRPERARAVLDLAIKIGLDAWAPAPGDLVPGGLPLLSNTQALSATWRGGGGEDLFPGATVIERDGFRLGVVGLSAPAAGLEAVDPVEAARAAMTGLEADAWVALSNLHERDAVRVAEGVSGLGAVLSTRGGALDAPRETRGAPVLETPDRGRYLSVLRLALGSDGSAWTVVHDGPAADLAHERARVARLEKPEAIEAGKGKVAALRERLASVAAGHDLVLREDRPLGSELDGPSSLDARIASFKLRTTEAAAARTAKAPEFAGYATAAACVSCHQDRFTAWTLDPHARAYEALIPRKANLDVECIACHSTGWGEPGGNATLNSVAMRTWKSVQCESCHGPLAGHPQRDEVHARPISEATCTGCHDAANSPEFDYAAYLPKVSCSMVSRRAASAGP